MGNCTSVPPNTQNYCSSNDFIGQKYAIPDACTAAGFPPIFAPRTQNPTGVRLCSALSNQGEWILDNERVDQGNCATSTTNNGNLCVSGQSQGDWGYQPICVRQKFTGDPLSCCLANYNCTGTGCFSDPGNNKTCAPEYRSRYTPSCQPLMFEYCTGEAPGDTPDTNWFSRWDINSPNSCYRYMINALVPGDPEHCSPGPIPVPGVCNLSLIGADAPGYELARNLMERVIEKYMEMGYMVGSLPGESTYNAFQEFLYNYVCCPYPALCQSALQGACSTQTAQRIQYNPNIAKWCGCHLPSSEYQEYSVKYNLQPQCTPMCNRVNVIKQSGPNLDPVLCTTNSCIIDDVTVNLINSQVGGGINFDQICGQCNGCNPGENCTCSCIIDSTEVDILNSQIGGNVVPALQQCGQRNCVQRNAGLNGPEYVPISCSEIGTNIYSEYDAKVLESKERSMKISTFWTLVAVGIGLVVIFLLVWFLFPRKSY